MLGLVDVTIYRANDDDKDDQDDDQDDDDGRRKEKLEKKRGKLETPVFETWNFCFSVLPRGA